ncbi:hypothetical protein [Burkholderia cenocepacia]|uniref:hypothetical protein n=1 Tax=Burkholderia cenocepacia TaxID=95486 RepID=UPI002012C2EF|nr:hypothetical protein [Burkholderia cenocepacia]
MTLTEGMHRRRRLYQPRNGGIMGSSGSGNFSDYPGTKAKEVVGDGTGMAGGASGVDKCKQAFAALLDDVGQCDFYSQFKKVPSAGDQLGIVFDKTRIFAVDVNGVKVGALPTALNYLAACLASGVTYIGVVKSSAEKPVPTVEADFGPQ